VEGVSERERLRRLAKERLFKAQQGSGGMSTWLTLGGVSGVMSGFVGYVTADEDFLKGYFPPLSDLRTYLRVNVFAMAKPLMEPPRKELLAAWPLPGVPPGMPPPPTLILDLEGTLTRPEWSRKHGWRYAKRPGFDAFLKEMSKYYEIVLFSSQHMFSVAPFLEKEMQKGYISQVLFRSEMKWRNGHLVKPIDYINRPRDRIICLDCKETMLELNMEHALFVPEYDDEQVEDDVLQRITPFLVALVTEDVRNFPALLQQLGTHDALEASQIHRSRVMRKLQDVEDKKRRGLGRFVHRSPLKPELSAGSDNPLSAKAIAAEDAHKAGDWAEGADEPVVKGGLWKMLDQRSRDKEERTQRTMEKFNDMMMKKEQEKANGN